MDIDGVVYVFCQPHCVMHFDVYSGGVVDVLGDDGRIMHRNIGGVMHSDDGGVVDWHISAVMDQTRYRGYTLHRRRRRSRLRLLYLRPR